MDFSLIILWMEIFAKKSVKYLKIKRGRFIFLFLKQNLVMFLLKTFKKQMSGLACRMVLQKHVLLLALNKDGIIEAHMLVQFNSRTQLFSKLFLLDLLGYLASCQASLFRNISVKLRVSMTEGIISPGTPRTSGKNLIS